MAELRIERGTEPGRVYPLADDAEAFLGRAKTCAIPIEENDISRQHARIFPRDGSFWVEDLGSRNGTAVNGRRLERAMVLAPGDHIRIGRTWLSFSPDQARDPLKLLQSDYLVQQRCPASYLLYQATQRQLARTVALAVFPSAGRDPDTRARFLAMLDARARLDHRHLQTLLDYGFKEEVGYFAAEWIDGPTLARSLANTRPLAPRAALHIVSALASALAQIHRSGGVHGGVSPETIRLDDDRAVLVEIALDELTGESRPAHAAPEGSPSPAADVYALAVVGLEALTGTNPFAGASEEESASRHAGLDRASLAPSLRVAGAAAQALLQALSIEPQARPAAADLSHALRDAADALPPEPTVTPTTSHLAAAVLGDPVLCWILFPALAVLALLLLAVCALA